MLCVPKGEHLQLNSDTHTTKVEWHFGVGKIMANLQRYVNWPKMQEKVARFIRGWMLCCTNNPSNKKKELFHPLPVPTHPWESIPMYFMGGLLITMKGHDYMFMIIDKFRNMCVMIPYKNTINKQEASKLFFGQV